jgi:hypothetical protein
MQRRHAYKKKNMPSLFIGYRGLFFHAFLVISLPQHIKGTLQAPSDPDLQVQVFFTSNSKPHVLQ